MVVLYEGFGDVESFLLFAVKTFKTIKNKLKMDQDIPFEIYCEIYSFLCTCKDMFHFRSACQLFYHGLPTFCQTNEPAHPLRESWLNHLFGIKKTNQPLNEHHCMKHTQSIPTPLMQHTRTNFAVIGTSKKLFKFSLNLINQHNHVGGAIFGTHDRLSPIAHQYSPSSSFLTTPKLAKYVDDLGDFIGECYRTETITDSKTLQLHCRSFLILFHFNDLLISNNGKTSALFRGRHMLMDFLYQEDEPSRLSPVERSQTDCFLLKKQRSTNMQQISTFFHRLGINKAKNFLKFNQTLKSNFVMLVYYMNSHKWKTMIIDISNILKNGYLGDQHFWLHLTNQQ